MHEVLDLPRWLNRWQTLEVPPSSALISLYAQLLNRYAEPHRHYHTTQHLQECLLHLQEVEGDLEYPDEIALALWFHDAIYDTQRDDNEERSSRLAIVHVLGNDASPDTTVMVSNLILSTRHDAVAEDPTTATLIDIDLAILGAPRTRFMEYERQIRQEYHWVPAAQFEQKRSAILEAFLSRPAIYGTPYFHERLEERARGNLKSSLKMLKAGGWR